MDIPTRYTPPAGLCESCTNVRIVESGKGSRFYLCRLASVDPRFPRYPRLPVLRCHGYQPADAPGDAGEGDAGEANADGSAAAADGSDEGGLTAG